MKAKSGIQEMGNHPISSKELDPCIGSNERRRQVRNNNQYIQKAAAPDFESPHEVSHWEPQGSRQESRYYSDLQGIYHGTPIKALCKEVGEILERKGTGIPCNNAFIENKEKRIQDKKGEERQNKDTEKIPNGHFLIHGLHLLSLIFPYPSGIH